MARPGFLFRFDILDRFAHVDSAVLGDWLRLQASAGRALNGGRWPAAQVWDDRRWMRTAGVARADLDRVIEAGLARWDGADLVLEGYDQAGEDLYRRQSAGGRDGAAKRHGKESQQGDPPRTPSKDTQQGEAARSHGQESDQHTHEETQQGYPATHSSAVQCMAEQDPPPPPAAPDPARAAPARGGANARIQAVDPQAVASAIDGRSLPRLLSAFCADLTDGAGWRRETHGLALGQVAHVLAWRFARRDPIRQPSGWRKAWEAWQALDPDEALAAATANHDLLGLPMPKRAAGAA